MGDRAVRGRKFWVGVGGTLGVQDALAVEGKEKEEKEGEEEEEGDLFPLLRTIRKS